jgi:MFS family permease
MHFLAPIAALLAGVALLLLGGGLLGTLLAVQGSGRGFSDAVVGVVMSGYFVGFFFGTFLAPRIIRRIGHIRAFALFAALATCAVLMHVILVSPAWWFVFRVVTGIALVALYTVIESWLSARSDAAERGRVFAVYMVVTLAALAAGQHLLRLDDGGMLLFALVAILVCAAMIPVTLTRQAQPTLHDTPRLNLAHLYRRVPTAVAGALFSGLAMGAFWALGPLFATRSGLVDSQIAWFMSIGILGGMLLQWPIGRLSDRHDRRYALLAVAVLAAVVSLFGALGTVGPDGPRLGTIYAVVFLYGGLAFAIYPVSVAHLMDHLDPTDLLQGSSTVLLLHGIGAALSPLLAGVAMGRLGPAALWYYFAATQLLLATSVGWRLIVQRRAASFDGHFLPMLRTTPAALDMIPDAAAASNVDGDADDNVDETPPAL